MEGPKLPRDAGKDHALGLAGALVHCRAYFRDHEPVSMTDLRNSLEATLGATYRIERELGGGGMSRVFLAEEVALGRRVVIKVLPPEMAAGVNQDRFRREIQVAARLQHPHIVPLLAAGAEGDVLWYAMPYIAGESLRVKLAREGELPVPEAARILREVADALSHAHSEGVVHRDIKPDNVMLSGRHALVTDFGVAKAVSDSTGGQNLTSLGVALGTPAYMAPEQATADPHVDHRADLYGLGAMAYEMLTGQPPFTGPTPQAVLAAHVTQTPTAIAQMRPAVPPALSVVVMRCLEKRAADRWQRADELIPHLEALLTPTGGTTPTASVPIPDAAALRRADPVRVAVLFGLASIAVLAGVWWIVQRAGLPDWVLFAAAALLVAGLPVMLLASRHERRQALAPTTGIAITPPGGVLGRLKTLRGAVAGGVIAFIALAVGAAGFMTLRALGVGPFATLVSAGVLKERDQLVLADFENRTTDSTLGQSVTEALRIDLARSPVLRLLENADVDAALRRMERNPDTDLTPAVAREVAEREGAAAVVTGEISTLGAGFVLAARLVAVGDGRTLLAERETAADATELIAAVDRLSRKLREGIGESLRSIRAGEPLEEVTTSSLDALRKYTQAEQAADRAQYQQSVTLLEEALRLDSTFAMAWRKLGVVLGNQGVNRSREIEAISRAFVLRDRLPERERLITTAYYYGGVEIDLDRQIAAYEQVLERWQDDVVSLNNVSISYQSKGRYADAERVARRGTEVSPQTGVLWANLVASLVYQGRFETADSVLNRWAEVAPEARNRAQMGFTVAFERGDYEGALRWADSSDATGEPTMQVFSRLQKAATLTITGRLAAATPQIWEAIALEVRRGNAGGVPQRAVPLARAVLVRGHPEEAIRQLDSILARYPLDSVPPADRNYLGLANFFATAGNLDRAEGYYTAWQRALPETVRLGEPARFGTEGLIALGRGRPAEALTAFRTIREKDDCVVCWLPELGQAFEALNQPDSALAAYEAWVTTPEGGPSFRQFTLPPTLIRLGELYETKGNRQKALEYYGRFTTLWKDADPDLQPKVAEIKRRVAELAGEPRS
jgi:eukaryotic-like serine/threonine-protein kinase